MYMLIVFMALNSRLYDMTTDFLCVGNSTGDRGPDGQDMS